MTFKRLFRAGLAAALVSGCFVLAACGGSGDTDADVEEPSTPLASIVASSLSGPVPFTVDFNALTPQDAAGQPHSYEWTFGDGSVVRQSDVQYTFNTAGVFDVTLRVTDSQGNIDSQVIWITASDVNANYNLFGTVSAMPQMDIDGDTNDPAAPRANNNGDSVTDIQPLSNPVLLSGFLTAEPTGVAGEVFSNSVDESDVYAVNLAVGEYVSIRVVEPAAADVDLFLLEETSFNMVASSTGANEYESIRVPRSGAFYILVRVASGTSSYVLNVGPDSFITGANNVGQTGNFEPLQAVLKLRSEESRVRGSRVRGPRVLDEAQLSASHHCGERECLALINQYNPQTVEKLNMRVTSGFEALIARRNPRAASKLKTLRAVKQLRGADSVELAELNYRVQSKLMPNDSLFALQWNYPAMNLPSAWDTTIGDENIVVAVVDSGVYYAHPELQGQLVEGYDFISSVDNALDGDGLDPDPADPGADNGMWHGTHVTGAVVAKMNNGQGIAGVAPGSKVMPLRVIGADGGLLYDVLQAVRYAAGLENDSGLLPNKAVDIINLSLGGAGYSQSAQNLFSSVYEKGIFLVAASGNENSSEPMYPSSYDGVISVAAYDYAGNRASYSNYNEFVDVAAPGGDYTTDLNNDGYGDGIISLSVVGEAGSRLPNYALYEGTSVAAPQVAGIIALMKSVYPNLTPSVFDSLLVNGDISLDMGEPGHDASFGHGKIDALLAIQAAQGLAAGEETAAAIAAPASAVFGNSTDRIIVSVLKVGTGQLRVTSTEFSEDWLSAKPLKVAEDGFGQYEVLVDRSNIAPGSYTAEIEFYTSANTVLRLPVSIRVGDLAQKGNAGRIYIMLIDAETDQAVASIATDGAGGEYAYEFKSIPIGRYYVAASTDLNFDGRLCSLGEVCGYYPTYSQRSAVNLESDKSGLNFTAGLYNLVGPRPADAETLVIERLFSSVIAVN